MGKTLDLLVNSDLLPISIVIIGIGDSDFSHMQELDGGIKLIFI